MKFPFISDPTKSIIKFDKDHTFQELGNLINKARNREDKKIMFFDSDGNCLSSGEIIEDWDCLPVLIKVDKESSYILNFNTQFKLGTAGIVEGKTVEEDLMINEEAYQSFCHQAGMTVDQRHFLANFANKMHVGLGNNKEITPQNLQNMIQNLQYFYSAQGGDRELYKELTDEMKEKNVRLHELKQIEAKIEKRAL